MSRKILLILALIAFLSVHCLAQKADTKPLKQHVEAVIKKYNATVGIAILNLEDGAALTINNTHHYPMLSVFKFPLAIYVLHLVDKGKLSLNQKIHISKEELHPDTWSPLKEKYPEGNIDLPLSELLEYTVSKSDNNGCDILFRLVKGTKPVNDYIHQLGVKNISIVATEAQMGASWDVQYTNWAEPTALVHLLEGVFRKKYLSATSNNFLLKIMTESANSPKRIIGLLPERTIVAHKTGTSNTNEKGMTAATNDVGIITLPNGKHIAIAVFVSNTMEKPETNERIIAEIAKATYDHFNEKK